MGRRGVLATVPLLVLLCAAAVLLRLYFSAYGKPYMMNEVRDLSPGWSYGVSASAPSGQISTPGAGEMLVLSQRLDYYIEDAAIMVRANHQTIGVYLDDIPLAVENGTEPGGNPGMSLHFIPLPGDYLHRTLRLELSSPYALYSERIGAVLMGTLTSLEAYAISQSMQSVIMMAMCLLLGIATIALTLMQAVRGEYRPENLAIGIFALIWALYWVCTEYIVFQFFTPFWMSALSMGLYFSFQAPLSLYFYFSFRRCRKFMLPAVILHVGFPAAAVLLQIAGAVDLPRLVNVNNILLLGLAYTLVLSVLEALGRNRVMAVASAFLALSYISMLFNFSAFYTGHGVPPYSYKYTYFLLLLCVLGYNIQQFFSSYYRNRQENERIGAELDIAARIQTSMLPCLNPPFPNGSDFDIFAYMLPAKEVGGDFFDFFMVDEDTLAVVIADVSGKGVPAALFMVVAKTLLKNNAQSGRSPREVFETVNDMLCENNEESMFVTAFMGFVSIKNETLTFVNAGHNPPLIKGADGKYGLLKSKPSLFLAGMEGSAYREETVAFSPGDVLLLYTDGVTEAMDRKGRLFSEARLLKTANDFGDYPIKEQLARIKREIDLFADGEEQSDDITMLILQTNPG